MGLSYEDTMYIAGRPLDRLKSAFASSGRHPVAGVDSLRVQRVLLFVHRSTARSTLFAAALKAVKVANI